MAGIGFELRKILRRQTFSADLAAHLYAAMLSSGPWIMSIICLALLGTYHRLALGERDHEIFRSTVIYSYAFSLIGIGAIQMVATRYLADRHYEGNESVTLATLMNCIVLTLVFGLLFMSAVYSFFDLFLLYKVCAIILFLVISLVWVCMIFLSAIKDYNSVVYAFALGALLSIGAALVMGRAWGVVGFLVGYTLGQALTLFWLLARLLTEYPAAGLWDRHFMASFRKYWALMLVGFLFNCAIWADKIVFWFAPDARMIVPYFKIHDLYESPVFFAWLSIAPTLAIFFLRVETRFYECYQQYFARVLGRKSMKAILEEKFVMVSSLKKSLREILIIQGLITLLCVLFAEPLGELIRLTPLQIPLFRIVLVGAFLQALLSVNFIVLFYFDLRKSALLVALVFLLANIGLSKLSLVLGFSFYGYGYTYACLVSLLLAFYLLDARMNDLEYLTFSGQPVE